MKNFSFKENSLNQINEQKFGLEKDIQLLTESNMNKVFGLEFVKSEYSLNSFRIDSLCFDLLTNSFVIVEYKNTKNFSVIDQGYSYLGSVASIVGNAGSLVFRHNYPAKAINCL